MNYNFRGQSVCVPFCLSRGLDNFSSRPLLGSAAATSASPGGKQSNETHARHLVNQRRRSPFGWNPGSRSCRQSQGGNGCIEQSPNHRHRNLKAFEEHIQNMPVPWPFWLEAECLLRPGAPNTAYTSFHPSILT